jgi:hypothetical protein
MKLGTSSSGIFRVYHGTNAEFTRFSMEFAARPGMAGNGHLGVWVAATNGVAKSFGTRCLIVHMQVDKAYRMPIGELAAMNRHCSHQEFDSRGAQDAYDRAYYTQYRQKLLVGGFDCIFLEESEGHIEMGICLDPSKLYIPRTISAAA